MEKQNKSIDLSHHLSDNAKAHIASPLKGLQKYFGRPDMIALAGGCFMIAYITNEVMI